MDLSVLVRIGLVLARPATLIMAAPVFGGAFGIEGDEAFQNFFIAKVSRPVIGCEDSGI